MRIWASLLAAVALTLSAAACQDRSTEQPEGAAPTATTAASAVPDTVPASEPPPTAGTDAPSTPPSTAPRTTDPTESTSAGPDDSIEPAETDPTIAEDRGLDDGDEIDDFDDLDDLDVDTEVVIGRSVEDRPITIVRRGTAGGKRVLVVGVIHGDEDAGTDIVDVLRLADVPDGVELWLVRSMNPDGQAHEQRHNANGVDLNRNFAQNWGPVAEPGNWQYAGPGPASEPETQVITELGQAVRPDLVLWYHQDLFRISPSTGRDGEIRRRYAELTGLPLVTVTGGTYTGTASQWSRTVVDPGGVGFTVELGATLTRDDAIRHADAVLTVASEM